MGLQWCWGRRLRLYYLLIGLAGILYCILYSYTITVPKNSIRKEKRYLLIQTSIFRFLEFCNYPLQTSQHETV